MKKILLALALLLPTVAFAQSSNVIRNDNAATTTQNTNLQPSKLSVNNKGQLFTLTTISDGSTALSVIPVSNNTNLNGLGTSSIAYARAIADAAETGSTTTVINATAHSARVGDVIQFTSGTAGNLDAWAPVTSVATNTITVTKAFPVTPANGDGFYVLRPTPQYASDPRLTGTGAGLMVAVDSGYQVAATGILKLEDAASASGDAGVAILANVNTSYSSLASAGDYTTPAVNNLGAFYVSLDANMQGATASPVRKEDQAFADAEGLMVSGGVKQNSNPTSFGGTSLDVTPVAVNSFGDIYVDLNANHRENAGASVIKLEDAASVDSDAGLNIFARVKGDFNASAADGDYANFNVDLEGRLATNPWGADTSEFFDVCATATATTADVQLKAAVASNRIYISSIDCKNSSATTATNLDFKDGSGLRATGGIAQMATTSPGSFSVTFPKPLRGTVNTDFNFATTVSVSSVACCAHGFISGN